MMKIKYFLVIFILVICASGWRCGKKPDFEDVPNGGVLLNRDTLQRSNSGVRVFSKSGISSDRINEIERGLRERAAIAAADGHTLGLNVNFYEAYIPALGCVLSPVQRIWSFRVRADNYDGTEYDQDPRPGIGVIFAAEMVLDYNGRFVVCEQDPADASGNYLDHLVLRINPTTYPDGLAWFYATETHTTYGHPLLPRGKRGFGGEAIASRAEAGPSREMSGEEAKEIAKDLNYKPAAGDFAIVADTDTIRAVR